VKPVLAAFISQLVDSSYHEVVAAAQDSIVKVPPCSIERIMHTSAT
jgi:hypothetical protein